MPANFNMADNRFQAKICVIQDGRYYSKWTPNWFYTGSWMSHTIEKCEIQNWIWILRISCPSIFNMPDIQVLLSPCTTEFKMVTIQILRIPCTRKFKTATIWFYSGSSVNNGLKSMQFRVATIWFYTEHCVNHVVESCEIQNGCHPNHANYTRPQIKIPCTIRAQVSWIR